MSRLIIFLIILAAVYWVIKRAFFPGKGRVGKTDEAGEDLVQDPFCQCYFPKSQSYVISLQGKKLFFCSEDCCKKYMASRAFPKS